MGPCAWRRGRLTRLDEREGVIGAIIITGLGLLVGLAGLYLAWRFVRGLPTEDHTQQAGDADTAPPKETKPDPMDD